MTSVHGGVAVVGWEGLWPICRFSTACTTVGSIGGWWVVLWYPGVVVDGWKKARPVPFVVSFPVEVLRFVWVVVVVSCSPLRGEVAPPSFVSDRFSATVSSCPPLILSSSFRVFWASPSS